MPRSQTAHTVATSTAHVSDCLAADHGSLAVGQDSISSPEPTGITIVGESDACERANSAAARDADPLQDAGATRQSCRAVAPDIDSVSINHTVTFLSSSETSRDLVPDFDPLPRSAVRKLPDIIPDASSWSLSNRAALPTSMAPALRFGIDATAANDHGSHGESGNSPNDYFPPRMYFRGVSERAAARLRGRERARWEYVPPAPLRRRASDGVSKPSAHTPSGSPPKRIMGFSRCNSLPAVTGVCLWDGPVLNAWF
jgi:hypothetical protein